MRNKKCKCRSNRSIPRLPIESLDRRLLMSTYTVNTLSDAVTPVAGQLTLRQAVADVNTNGGDNTIAFDPTVFTPGSLHTITLTQSQLEINNSTGTTTITGPGETVLAISGGGASRVLQVDAGAVVSVSGTEITDGSETAADSDGFTEGGGISNAGNLTMANSSITGNSVLASAYTQAYENAPYVPSPGDGGGVYSSGPLTITNSILSGNSVSVTLPAQNADDHTAGVADGGAIYASGLLSLTGDTITNNQAEGFSPSELSAPNVADGTGAGGGGVDFEGASTAAIDSCVISGNSAIGGSAQYGYSLSQGGSGWGGGIQSVGSLVITSSTINSNHAVGGNPGLAGEGNSATAVAGAAIGGGISAEILTITGSEVDDTTTSEYYGSEGGGISVQTATITSTTISGNGATGIGGGLCAGNLTLQSCTISGNTIVGNPIAGRSDTNLTTGGGGLYTLGTASIEGCTISNNSIVGGPGLNTPNNPYPGSTVEGGGIFSAAPLTLTNSTIAENSISGGAGSAATSTFAAGNGGGADGGGIYATSDLTVAGTTITDNSTGAGAGGAASSNGTYPAGGQGTASCGGVDEAGSPSSVSASLTNSIVSGNNAANIASDVAGAFGNTSGYNLIGIGGGLANGVNGNLTGVTNPDLGTLANNGGPTLTMLPLAGSPVIDAGSNALIPSGITTDQRGAGFPRIVRGVVDIGAVEYSATAALISVMPPTDQTAIAGQSVAVMLGSFTQPNGAGPYAITVNWGDGSSGHFSVADAGAIPAEPHTFASVGTDTVSLSVADSTGDTSAIERFLMNVSSPALVATTVSLAASTSLANGGGPVTLTAVVAGNGVVIPTGSVTFSLNGATLGTAALSDGSAALTLSTLPIGSDAITASYGGDSGNAGSSSAPVTVTIAKPSQVTASLAEAVMPASNIAGQKLNARLPLVLDNTGAVIKGAFIIRIYASTKPTFNSSAMLLESVTRKLSIKANHTASITSVIRSLPATLPGGSYYLLAQVTDPAGLFNIAATARSVAVAAPFVNLSAVVGTVSPAIITARKAGVLSIAISNSGNISATGLLTISLQPSVDAFSPGLNVLGTYRARITILAGKNKMIRLRVKVPKNLVDGSYYPFVSVTMNGTDFSAQGTMAFTVG